MPPNRNYDPEVEDKNSSSGTGNRLSSNSTSGQNASFSRGDNLDPVRRAEQNGRFKYNPQGDSAGSSEGGASDITSDSSTGATKNPTSGRGAAESPGQISSREEDPNSNGSEGGYTRGNMNSTGRSQSRFRVTRKRAIIGVGSSAIITAVFGFLSISSGPLEFIHIAQLLEKFHFSAQQNAEDSRLVKIARYIRDPSKPQNTRLGIVGNAVADHLETKIHEATGLNQAEFDNKGNFKGYPVDTEHQNFKGLSDDEIKQKLIATYPGLSDANITRDPATGNLRVNPENGGSKFNPITTAKNYFAETGFARTLLGSAGYSKLSQRVGARVLRARAGWTFHQIKKLDKAILDKALHGGKKALDKLKNQELQKEAVIEDGTNTTKTPEERAKDKSTLKDKTAKGAGAAGLGVAFFCGALQLQKTIQHDRQEKAVLPMARKAGEAIQLGSQVQSGQDITATQLGFYKDFLSSKDSNGNVTSTWNQAKSIQDELGQPQTGPDIPKAGQVFGGTPLDFLNGFPLLPQICDALGTPVISTLTTVIGGLWGFLTSELTSTAISTYADWNTGAPIDPLASGADYGNYVNYGARISANDQFASTGGVQLNSSQELALKDQNSSLDNTAFQKKSLAYRLFNTSDSQSLASQVIDNQNPNLTQNVAHMFSGLGSVFSSAIKIPGSLFSSLAHAAPPTYDYHGLKAAGFTAQELTDPLFDNPFDNGCYVAGGDKCNVTSGPLKGTLITPAKSILGDPANPSVASADLINRVSACYGDKVSPDTSGMWKIDFNTSAVDMYGDSYGSANCNENSTDWKRIRFWLLDTATIEGFDCGIGNSSTSDTSCQDMGFGPPSTTTTQTPTPTPLSCQTPGTSYFTVNGNLICDKNGNQFIPYGISIIDDLDQPSWQATKYQAASDAQIQAAAQYWHSNAIRLQVSEVNIMDNPTPSKGYNQAAMDRLGAEVDEIEALGKIPMLNDNVEQTNKPQTAPTSRTIAFWKAVNEYFAGKNVDKYSNVIFDIFNEAHLDGSVWQSSMQNVVDTIRGQQNALKDNLIMIEGPQAAGTLSELDTYPLKGSNLAFAFHHQDLNDPSSWDQKMGLKLKTPVPIIDGEWSQYASTRGECFDQAPKNIPAYFAKLHDNNIGLIFWSLEPGVGTQTNQPQPVTDKIGDNWIGLSGKFPVTAADYSQPNSFQPNYSCTGGTNGQNLIDQGAGSVVMQYFQKYGSN